MYEELRPLLATAQVFVFEKRAHQSSAATAFIDAVSNRTSL